jgi:hypothetical protein
MPERDHFFSALLLLSAFEELSFVELSLFVLPSFFEAESPLEALLAVPDFLA